MIPYLFSSSFKALIPNVGNSIFTGTTTSMSKDIEYGVSLVVVLGVVL